MLTSAEKLILLMLADIHALVRDALIYGHTWALAEAERKATVPGADSVN